MMRSLNQDFFKTWSPEMAYVLGYFAADGCIVLNKRGGMYIEFTSTDRILIDIVQRATGSTHVVAQRERGGSCRTAYRIQIGSKSWFEDLLRLGFTPNKSNNLPFPLIPEALMGDFVRGYFDGDGCVYFKSHFAKDRNHMRWVFQTQFISGSKTFLEALWSQLKDLGVTGGHIYERKSGTANLVFAWTDSLALYRLMYNTLEVRDVFLPRKKEKFERAIRILALE